MKPMNVIRRIVGLLLIGATASLADAVAPSPLRVLIFSGQNNHRWQETTPKLQAILTATGRFAVDITEHPERCTAEMLAKYDVLLSNWNTFGKNVAVTNWPEATKQAFLQFIRSGKGFVVVHAGSSSFYDWLDYQQVAGASWKLGQTHHNKPHTFTVKAADLAHPIVQGLEPFTTTDELWCSPGVQPAAQVLAVAEEQPVALVTRYGQGRGFALLMGHAAGFMVTPGFQALLVRGTEWAATGKVSQSAVDKIP